MMSSTKFTNIQQSLMLTCRAEEKKKDGNPCGYLLLIVELQSTNEDGTENLQIRMSSGMPTETAKLALRTAMERVEKVTQSSQDESPCIQAPVLPL